MDLIQQIRELQARENTLRAELETVSAQLAEIRAAATAIERQAPIQAQGALAGTLPRDHISHAFCGARFCVTQKHFSGMVRAYGGTEEESEDAVGAWLAEFDRGLSGAYGGPIWLLQHWDAHLMAIGRVQPAPVAKPKKPDWKAAVLARDAAKGQA